MNKCLINHKIIISGFISEIIAKVFNAFFTNYLVKFENKLKKNTYILNKHLVVPPLLTKENKIQSATKYILAILTLYYTFRKVQILTLHFGKSSDKTQTKIIILSLL